jgi:hypothetical protein
MAQAAVEIYFIILLLCGNAINIEEGKATYYSYGLMQRVAYRRAVLYGELEKMVIAESGCLAATNGSLLGDFVFVVNGNQVYRCYVVDVAEREHGKFREMIGLVLELDYATYKNMVKINGYPARVSVFRERQ